MLGTEPTLAAYKTNYLPTVLSLWPQPGFILLQWLKIVLAKQWF